MIVDVNKWMGVLQFFPHLLTAEAPTGYHQAVLIAALMESGMNIGPTKMAQACDFSEQELMYSAEWHIREETLRLAMAELDNFVLHHPFSRHWGSGVASSSDGMRVPVIVNAPNAVYNARHFWYRRGITIVAHAADIWMPFYPQVMQDTSEALYVIDALCHHETDFDMHEFHEFSLWISLRSLCPRWLFSVDSYYLLPTVHGPDLPVVSVNHQRKGVLTAHAVTHAPIAAHVVISIHAAAHVPIVPAVHLPITAHAHITIALHVVAGLVRGHGVGSGAHLVVPVAAHAHVAIALHVVAGLAGEHGVGSGAHLVVPVVVHVCSRGLWGNGRIHVHVVSRGRLVRLHRAADNRRWYQIGGFSLWSQGRPGQDAAAHQDAACHNKT